MTFDHSFYSDDAWSQSGVVQRLTHRQSQNAVCDDTMHNKRTSNFPITHLRACSGEVNRKISLTDIDSSRDCKIIRNHVTPTTPEYQSPSPPQNTSHPHHPRIPVTPTTPEPSETSHPHHPRTIRNQSPPPPQNHQKPVTPTTPEYQSPPPPQNRKSFTVKLLAKIYLRVLAN